MKVKVSPGACDTHMHSYDTKVSGAPGTFLPGNFSVAHYRAPQKRLGLERVIVVQPNAYADDNRVTLEAMKQLGKSAKGVAAVKPGVPHAELERLTRAGICAVRIMTLHGGLLGFDVMDEVMARVHPFGWHANLQFDGRELGRCWVKLSAPYETSKTGAPNYEDVGLLATALVQHAPERMLWASNWPHPSARKPAPPRDEDLLDLLGEWAPDARVQKRILTDNPAELYRF